MQFNAIVDRVESFKAFQEMQFAFYKNAQLFPHQAVGHQGDTLRKTVFWIPHVGLWAALDVSARKPNRFWNAFGLGAPETNKGLQITVEINPPHEGSNPSGAGLFVRDQNGQIWIAHSGKVGGGRPGIGATAFRQTIGEMEWRDIQTGEGTRKLLLFGPLNAPELVQQIAGFVHRVATFKAGD